MPKRFHDNMKWLLCLVVLHTGPGWSPVGSVALKSPPKDPKTVEAQSKFFQDFFSVQLSPYKIEFGHVCEDPNTWEQRYERNDLKNHRAMGKVRWGDKKGGYGEHYWDLNHAGHGDNHHDDHDHGYDDNEENDGSYDPAKYEADAYDEPSERVEKYQNEESPLYDAEKASYAPYDESGRSKRHHTVKKNKKHENNKRDVPSNAKPRKIKEKREERNESVEKEDYQPNDDDSEENYDQQDYKKYSHNKEQNDYKEDSEEDEEEPEPEKKSKKAKKPKDQTANYEVYPAAPVSENSKLTEDVPPPSPYNFLNQQQQNHFAPYDSGAGVRQQYPALPAPAYATAARRPYSQPAAVTNPAEVRQQYQASPPGLQLFLEPSTGRVIDRATGQAYVLQPVGVNHYR